MNRSLFPDPDQRSGQRRRASADERGAAPRARPLADRIRPRSLDEIVGQRALLGPHGPLRVLIETDRLASLLFWGPPGCGKTTIARLVAASSRARFLEYSAVAVGSRELKEVMREAARLQQTTGRRTILFLDEIHRFNKTQQDALLPWVERGDIVLIGATTENPSFELTSALLSRLRLFVLEPLQPDQVRTLLERALASDPALLELGVAFTPAALAALAELSEGDARQALGLLESLATIVAESPERRRAAIDRDDLDKLLQLRAVRYDKAGEEHFNLISALHKSLRNSDPDAAIYWLARMLAGGEDPLYIARRLVRFASEDVGLADPQALPQAVAARDAVRFIGLPEGALALTQAVVYLALAPKSNALYRAYQSAEREVQRGLNPPVPLHLRNAPTGMMRGLGYGRGYAYAHDDPEAAAAMSCLPDALAGRRFYTPRDRGFEKELADRLRALDAARRGARTQRADPSGASDPDSAGANIPGSTGANDSGRAPERRSDPQEASDETDRSADRRR